MTLLRNLGLSPEIEQWLAKHQPASLQVNADSALQLRLYITSDALNSVTAINNLKLILDQHDGKGWSVEVIDVLENPDQALNDGVLVIPTLIRTAPAPPAQIIGNLNDRPRVAAALGLARKEP